MAEVKRMHESSDIDINRPRSIEMKVFKKRSDLSLPPLPKPPTNEQMIEDIKSSDIDDPVYLEGSCQKMFDDRTKVDLKYESVKELIEANSSLNVFIKETGEKLTRLQSSRDELQKMAGKIRLQADQALQ